MIIFLSFSGSTSCSKSAQNGIFALLGGSKFSTHRIVKGQKSVNWTAPLFWVGDVTPKTPPALQCVVVLSASTVDPFRHLMCHSFGPSHTLHWPQASDGRSHHPRMPLLWHDKSWGTSAFSLVGFRGHEVCANVISGVLVSVYVFFFHLHFCPPPC